MGTPLPGTEVRIVNGNNEVATTEMRSMPVSLIYSPVLKGKYHVDMMSFQNPRTFVCQQK